MLDLALYLDPQKHHSKGKYCTPQARYKLSRTTVSALSFTKAKPQAFIFLLLEQVAQVHSSSSPGICFPESPTQDAWYH